MKNHEGYYDPTAGKAIENILKEDKEMCETMKGDILDVYTQDGNIGNPVMVVTADNNQDGWNVSVVYLKEMGSEGNPLHVPIRARSEMFAHCERVFTIKTDRIAGFIRSATSAEVSMVDDAICMALGITPKPEPIEETEKVAEDVQKDDSAIRFETTNALARAEEKAEAYRMMYENLLDRILQR